MKKQELVTEIENLLISINNHFTDVENNTKIPTIELDVISSKISKLHEKIAVFKFLNEQEGGLNILESKKLNKIEELKTKSFELPSSAILASPKTTNYVEEEVSPSISETIIIEEKITAGVAEENPNISFVSSEDKLPQAQEKPIEKSINNNTNSTTVNLPDIKKFFSINDKLLFQNYLFGNNTSEFTYFIDKINSFSIFQDANYYFESSLKQKNWEKDDDAVLALKRYIHKRFNA